MQQKLWSSFAQKLICFKMVLPDLYFLISVAFFQYFLSIKQIYKYIPRKVACFADGSK